jgi:hypothetical protein
MIMPSEGAGGEYAFTDDEVTALVSEMMGANSYEASLDILTAAIVGKVLIPAFIDLLNENPHA